MKSKGGGESATSDHVETITDYETMKDKLPQCRTLNKSVKISEVTG